MQLTERAFGFQLSTSTTLVFYDRDLNPRAALDRETMQWRTSDSQLNGTLTTQEELEQWLLTK